MENNDSKKESIEVKVEKKKFPIFIILGLLLVVIILGLLFWENSKKLSEFKINSTLEKIVEKSELQTISYKYNFIAKKCKKEKCDLNSNNINDFEMVVSCKGKITAGIDMEKVETKLDKKNKKIIIELPEATLSDNPNIESYNILNGDELTSGSTATAHNLCEDTIVEESKADEKILKSAKEQSKIILEEYYKSRIKEYDDSYSIEIK